MVHCSRSSTTAPSWVTSTAHKSPRRIPVGCSSSVWGGHICMYFRPGCVHRCNCVLCSTYQCSPFRIFLSEFTKFLMKECSLIWPLPSRIISMIMFFNIHRNEVIWFWMLDFFISTRDAALLFVITAVLSWPWACSNTCSSSSSYFLIAIVLLRCFF